jgi:hypothetical protein
VFEINDKDRIIKGSYRCPCCNKIRRSAKGSDVVWKKWDTTLYDQYIEYVLICRDCDNKIIKAKERDVLQYLNKIGKLN